MLMGLIQVDVYERKVMAKSVPRMPATAETPRAEAPFEVGDGAPGEEEPELAPELGAAVALVEGKSVYKAVD